MIYDSINNVDKYKGISKWLDIAFDFLKKTDLKTLPIGKTEIFEDKVYANVMEATALDEADINFEIHKKYIDIQLDIEGVEIIQIGLDSQGDSGDYKKELDYGTVVTNNNISCTMGPGRFIVCMSQEPHKPSIASCNNCYLKKCVIKVLDE